MVKAFFACPVTRLLTLLRYKSRMSRSSAPHNQPRLFVKDALTPDAQITLSTGQTHYLTHVMRLGEGSAVRLFNGHDGEWRATLNLPKKGNATARVNHQPRPQTPDSGPVLCCSPIKKAHFDNMIEKATELGVSEIRPILTARTQVREINGAHACSITIEAAEQSERLSVPMFHLLEKLDKIVESWPENLVPIVCAEWGEALPIHDALKNLKMQKNQQVAIITGPEGGFTPEELPLLLNLPEARAARLGPRILRADTAALAALSCWQALRGDWR